MLHVVQHYNLSHLEFPIYICEPLGDVGHPMMVCSVLCLFQGRINQGVTKDHLRRVSPMMRDNSTGFFFHQAIKHENRMFANKTPREPHRRAGWVIIPTIKGLPGVGLWIWGIRDRWLGGEEEGRHEDWEGKGGGGEERERTKGEIW